MNLEWKKDHLHALFVAWSVSYFLYMSHNTIHCMKMICFYSEYEHLLFFSSISQKPLLATIATTTYVSNFQTKDQIEIWFIFQQKDFKFLVYFCRRTKVLFCTWNSLLKESKIISPTLYELADNSIIEHNL